MSVTGLLRTSGSGLQAQSDRLSVIADNIANSNTTGYKRAEAEFSSIVLNTGATQYESGGVETHVRYAITDQGTFNYTSSVTDLAVEGGGFFLVTDNGERSYLTRAGAFVPDNTGTLVNSAGFKLLGYSLANGDPQVTANGTSGLETVNIRDFALRATASTSGKFTANLPSTSTDILAGNLPSDNAATSESTAKTSLVVYGNLGEKIGVDVYYAKTGVGTWEVTVFDKSQATATGGFPYSGPALATQTLLFDPLNGGLDASSAKSISFAVPGGQTVDLDLSQSSQLATGYTAKATVNGNGVSDVDRVEIADDGTLYAVFEDGSRISAFRIPLGDVVSANNLLPVSGNVFSITNESGELQVGFAGDKGFGSIVSGALEQSRVDVADELTQMIEAQQNYSINSKVFQTGAELLEILANLKR